MRIEGSIVEGDRFAFRTLAEVRRAVGELEAFARDRAVEVRFQLLR